MGKILFFKWNAFMQEGIERGLQELNMDYDTFYYIFNDWEKDDAFVKIFQSYVMENHCKKYDMVFSVNYSPLISSVCMEFGIHYVSWVYDEPLHIRNKRSVWSASDMPKEASMLIICRWQQIVLSLVKRG